MVLGAIPVQQLTLLATRAVRWRGALRATHVMFARLPPRQVIERGPHATFGPYMDAVFHRSLTLDYELR